ncbi:MAG: F0F1 ATP synthase subunit B [Candidatus Krumholzibacteria bacterium]|nr:F0F1 ATP synthase subunit B [Candidatus Krumholzibacteria bacterium]
MQVDWGQIVTHAIGFMIAVWLLKRYAWEHLLGFVEKRRETIAASFEEIDKGKADIASEKARLDQELENIEATRREKIQQAAQEAERLASEIREEARREAIATREKTKQDIAIELDKANEILKDRTIEAVLTATEKMIDDQLDRDKHNKLIDEFLNQVKAG